MDKYPKKPLISIITAVYNNEKYIRNVAKSVLEQEFRDIEYVIVDDGSTDRTSNIIDEIASKDERVKVIHQKNQWIFASYNNGIRAASGEYFYIVNSDDRLQENILSKIADYALKYKPDIIWTPVLMHKCDENQNIIEYDFANWGRYVNQNKFYENKDDVRESWIDFDRMKLSANQANLYKRELALEHPFRNDIYGADYLFNIQIANDVNSAYVMSEPVYDFMNYQSDDMNASMGNYYGYEHWMYNLFYSNNKRLYEDWKLWNSETETFIARKRLQGLSYEISTFNSKKCKLSLDEKFEKIMIDVADEIIEECVTILNAQEEFECRVLSGVRNLLLKEKLDETSDYYFIYELLESLLRYEKTEEDYHKIENAINHPLNKGKIGLALYQKICDKKFLF